MGFWQGLNAGIKAVQEERNRKEERQQEIDMRKAEQEAQRKYDREMFMEQVRQDRITAALSQRQKTSVEASAAVQKAAPDAAAFMARLEGVDDPRVADLAANPLLAAEMERELAGIEKEAAGKGIKRLPMLRGEALLEMMTVSLPDGGVARVELPAIEDILSRDLTDEEAYYTTMQEVSSKPATGTARLSPEVYYIPDPKVLEEGQKVFDQTVLRLATQAMNTADEQGDTEMSSDLRAKIEGYAKEGSAERFALMDTFGQDAFQTLAKMNNPYVQDIQNDPVLSQYAIVTITSDAEYEALPPNTLFIDPQGQTRRKP